MGIFSKKSEDYFGPLLEKYPKLIQKSKDGVDELNVSLAQTLIDQGLVDDATKALIRSTLDWQKQIDSAKEAINEIVKSLVGELGDKIRGSLTQAFIDGTDSAIAFKNAVEDVIESITEKLLFQAAFSTYFDQLEARIKKSFSPGGDMTIIDDLVALKDLQNQSIKNYYDLLKESQDFNKANGFDILQNKIQNKSANSSLNAVSRAISENTANLVLGQLTGMRVSQVNTEVLIRQQLFCPIGHQTRYGYDC